VPGHAAEGGFDRGRADPPGGDQAIDELVPEFIR